MSCEICQRNSCTRSFHSLDEQSEFDAIADKVKEDAKNRINRLLDRLDYEDIDGEIYIQLDQAIEVVDDVLW